MKNGRWVGHSQLLRGVVVVVWGGGGREREGAARAQDGWVRSPPPPSLSPNLRASRASGEPGLTAVYIQNQKIDINVYIHLLYSNNNKNIVTG